MNQLVLLIKKGKNTLNDVDFFNFYQYLLGILFYFVEFFILLRNFNRINNIKYHHYFSEFIMSFYHFPISAGLVIIHSENYESCFCLNKIFHSILNLIEFKPQLKN
ncbi:hypothetical protein BpHYR1_020166 [Brachionus plicatilis]|uniref:Uncharacterized protein n=1 Tax=Brachionus plicatilis TaxID=10195 RepID=A0A3M7QRA8_BRAPC|nr:hypothetical protein BpHYR1_020166 [Brachionus plicatilis]